MAEVISEAAGELGKMADDKGLRLEVEAIPCRVIADHKRLRQVLINLLGNAIKFTEEGRVEIRTELNHERDEVAVSVSDTGPGIPEDRCSDIFGRFKQVDGSSTRNAEGTGLGLAITKNLVELHGGRIRLDSTVGEGSTFTFTIPLAKQKAIPHEKQMEAEHG